MTVVDTVVLVVGRVVRRVVVNDCGFLVVRIGCGVVLGLKGRVVVNRCRLVVRIGCGVVLGLKGRIVVNRCRLVVRIG